MSTLTFTLKVSVNHPVDCKNLTPDALEGKSLADIAAIDLGHQNSASDIFTIEGNDTNSIVIKNSTDYLQNIGYRMKTGSITIEGDSGDFTGSEMQGGVLICKGNTGERTADKMRRGIVLVEGNTGDYCASSMQAGTVGILGNAGQRLAYGMKRGTLLLAHAPVIPATWLDCGLHTLPFLNILYQSFQQLDTKFASISQQRVHRWMGDASNIGKAEILVLQN